VIKNKYIQIDWGKWIDEDDEKEAGSQIDGFDLSEMKGLATDKK
jgi:hypothetical protein